MNRMKMMLKRLFCLVAVFFAFSITNVIAAPSDDFSDTHQGYWSYDAIMALKKVGILAGYPDGTFRPDENVTRAEFTAMISKALNLRNKDFSITNYKDLSQKHWAYRDIQIASQYGIMYGTPDNNFMANGQVKRVEVIMTIMSALNLKELTPEQATDILAPVYRDLKDLPKWALTRTGKAEQLHSIVVRPGEEGLLMPNRPATRGELAVFIYNMLERVKVHPNEKLQSALPTRKVDGYVLENAYLDGNIAIIPAGTVLPLGVMDCVWSKEAKVGDEFIARTLVNFVTKDKVLLIPIGREFKGTIQKAKKGTTLIKNAQMVFQTETLLDKNSTDSGVEFITVGNAIPKVPEFTHNPILQKIGYNVFKGHNFYNHHSQQVDFVLLEAARINIMDNYLAE